MSLPARIVRPNDETPIEAGWLVPLALGTWAALVAGIIVGLGEFADPRPWQNGCVRLMTLGATLAVLIWAVRTIHPERARSLKLAVIVSLIGHTLLAVMLSRQRLEFQAQDIAAQEKSKRPRMVETPGPNSYPLAAAGSQPNQDWQFTPTIQRPRPPMDRLDRQSTMPLDIAAITLSVNTSSQTPSLGPRQLLKRGPRALASPAGLPSATSLEVGAIELPPAESQQESIAARTAERKRPRPAPISSELARATAPFAAQSPIDLTLEPAGAGALDVDRLPSRRRLDAAPVFGMPAESERFALRTASPVRAIESRQPSPAYERRLKRAAPIDTPRVPIAGGGRLENEVELAIGLGLEFLARVQLDDGRWEFEYLGPSNHLRADERHVSVQADAAATGLALLAMLGAGYDHFDGRYRYSIQQGLDYLRGIQTPAGELFPENGQAVGQVTRFYGHGMATLALCEAYGMTGDAQLRRPAQAALDYLVSTQHRELGGWRYAAGTNADLSVTGWQLLALRSGELAGLNVPPETYARIRECLEQCREESGGRVLFRYNPWSSPTDPRTRHGREPSTVMTSVGLLMQLQLNGDRMNPQCLAAGDHLLANPPQYGDSAAVAVTGTLGNPGRDTYYWYYATQGMFQLGGAHWQAWHQRLFPLLVESQTANGPLAGSWDPRQPVPDKWSSYGGRLYVTTMNLLSLEVANRQLPLIEPPTPRVAEGP